MHVGFMEMIVLVIVGILVCAAPIALLVILLLTLKKNPKPPTSNVPLVTCPDCNHPVSSLAASCPNCGRPLSPQK